MTDEARMRASIEARLREVGADRSPLARWIRLNRPWIAKVMQESGAGWLALARALVETGVVQEPEGWSSRIAAERRLARRRLADAIRQAWRREVARRPGAVRQQRPSGRVVPDVFVPEPAPAVARAEPAAGDDDLERIKRVLDQRSGRTVPPPPADEDDDDARIRRVMEQRSGRRWGGS
jgi:hypothetical protein